MRDELQATGAGKREGRGQGMSNVSLSLFGQYLCHSCTTHGPRRGPWRYVQPIAKHALPCAAAAMKTLAWESAYDRMAQSPPGCRRGALVWSRGSLARTAEQRDGNGVRECVGEREGHA